MRYVVKRTDGKLFQFRARRAAWVERVDDAAQFENRAAAKLVSARCPDSSVYCVKHGQFGYFLEEIVRRVV